MFNDQFGGDLPMVAQRAAMRQCQHVVAGLADGAQGPAILGQDWPGEILGEVQHSVLRPLWEVSGP